MSDADRHEPGPKGGGGRAGAIRAFVAWWVLCAALWLALVDRTRLDELLTGVVAATIGATASVLVRQERRIVLRPRARWLVQIWRPLLALVTDLWPLTRALVVRGVLRRPGTGQVHEVELDAVGATPEQAAFRVLTAAIGSVGPNTVVLDVDEDEGVVRAHQLVPTSDPERSAMPLERP
jgi:multisubunit Na+/H+ antiporter MnhE subunit